MPSVLVKTTFGSIQFEYEDDEDLDQYLNDIQRHIKSVQNAVKDLIPRGAREPKPELAHIYRFTASGLVELFHYPSTNLGTCILVLYAYHPEMVHFSEVEKTTGIESVVSKVFGQTNNKKYFRRDGDLFGLSPEGLNYLNENVVVSLPSKPLESDSN